MKKKPLIILVCLTVVLLILGLKVENRGLPQESPYETTHVETSAKEAVLSSYLSRMTVEEKVGQLFFARVPAFGQYEDLEIYHPGGYLIFGRDVEGQSLESLQAQLANYQAHSSTPLLIGSDEEGGTVTRVSQLLAQPFASPQNLYHIGGLDLVLADTRSKAQVLKSLGIVTGFFPIADMAHDPSSFIYDRTLGQDLDTTKAYIAASVQVLKEEQFGSTLKHFPGYGDNADSHTEVVRDARPLSELQAYDLQTFVAGIEAGVDSILVSHNILTAIDEVPSSISPRVIRLLREDLGFSGVILTDDFDMAGLADFISQEEAAFRAIQAGNDMVLSSQYAIQIPYILDKMAQGELTEERLDQSVRRILGWKYDLGLLD